MAMGRPKKDPALVRSVPLNFRVSAAVKAAIDAMVARRAADTGDDSLTGWFLATVHREAKRVGIAIVVVPEWKPKPAKRKVPRARARRSSRDQAVAGLQEMLRLMFMELLQKRNCCPP